MTPLIGVMRPGRRIDLFLEAGFGWIRDGVREAFGVELVPEPVMVAPARLA